jgi:hypothetical protein
MLILQTVWFMELTYQQAFGCYPCDRCATSLQTLSIVS